MGERLLCKQGVVGSNPSASTGLSWARGACGGWLPCTSFRAAPLGVRPGMFFHMEIGFGQTVLFCCGVCVLCGWFGLHGCVCAVVGWRCLFDVCVYELVMATDPIGRGGVGLC